MEAQDGVDFIKNDCIMERGKSWFQVITGPQHGRQVNLHPPGILPAELLTATTPQLEGDTMLAHLWPSQVVWHCSVACVQPFAS